MVRFEGRGEATMYFKVGRRAGRWLQLTLV